MIKIHLDGLIYQSVPNGGIGRIFTNTTRQLLRDYADMRILLSLPAGAEIPQDFVPHLHRVHYGHFPRLLRPVLAAWGPDIYHPTYYTFSPSRRTKNVVTVYDFVDRRLSAMMPNGPGFFERQRQVIEQSDMLIAISESTRDDILRFTNANAQKIVVAYPALAEGFSAVTDLAAEGASFRRRFVNDCPYWLYVGGRHKYKNFDVLLHAFCELARSRDMHLVLVGGARQLENYQNDIAVRHHCENRIIQCPQVDDQILRGAYAGATALIQTSLWEGFGIPLIEAAACGAPLVLSDIAAFREVAGDAALYADPYDQKAWRPVLEATLTGPISERLRVDARAKIAGRFTWKQAAGQIRKAYEQALGS